MKQTVIILGFLSLFLVACNNTAPKEKVEQVEEVQQEISSRALPVEWTKNANIYEVNLRQYSDEGTFNAFAKELPRLQEMGVDILWFMPIHPIGEKNRKGRLGSYYAVKDYKATSEEFGTIEEFKSIVDEAHKLGMYVMIDWVANHTSWDNVWVGPHNDFYEKDEKGEFVSPFDWTDVIALDYSNMEMREAMADALKFWVKDVNIDGYRCDVAGEVPTDFWNWVRPQLEEIKPVFMLAESEKPELLESAFDMDYGWEFHHIMNQVAKGEKNVQDILTYLKKEKEISPENTYKLYFITNHDENSWNGTIKERMGEAEDVLSVLTYTLCSMPLTYSGQEAANEKRLEFFEKDVIEWKEYAKEDFLSQLMKMKHENPALFNGNYGGEFTLLEYSNKEQMLAFKRVKDNNDIVVFLNLSDKKVIDEVSNIDIDEYQQIIGNGFQTVKTKKSIYMMPWGYAVFKKK